MKQKILALSIATAEAGAEKSMEKTLHVLHRLLPKQAQLSLEFASVKQFLTFYIVVEENHVFLVKSQLTAQFPDIEITEKAEYLPESEEKLFVTQIDFKRASSSAFKTYPHLKESLLTSLFAILAKINPTDTFYFQLVIKKVGSKIYQRGLKGATYSLLSKNLEKMSKELYIGKLRVAYESKTKQEAKEKIVTILNLLKNVKGENELIRKKFFVPKNIYQKFRTRQVDSDDFWTCEELATLFHFPTTKTALAHVVHTNTKHASAPDFLPREHVSFIAETNYQNESTPFGIRDEDRRRHIYVIGKTGVGKSRFLELLMLSDIQNNKGFCLLDPHGDLAENILQQIPQNRIRDVIYVDPTNRDFPIAFNPLEYTKDYEKRQHIVFFFISIFKKIFAADWNERMEHLLRYIILAILETKDSNILGIPRILSDVTYRHRVISQIQDPVVRQFWANEFSSWNEQYASTTIVPILNKVGQFVANPIIRNMVGQQQNALDFENFMNTGKIVIINVSKGKLGEENAELLGSMFITKIQQAALARAAIKEENRQDFYFYIDEFQNFATEAFKSILSESRKYRLNLTLAHQYIDQLSDDVKASVFGNVASLFVFAVGGDDATYLANEFAPTFTTEDILSLETREMYVKMSINGRVTKPFSARTLNTPVPQWNYKQEIITHTQSHFGNNRMSVERAIEKWLHTAKTYNDEERKHDKEFPEPII